MSSGAHACRLYWPPFFFRAIPTYRLGTPTSQLGFIGFGMRMRTKLGSKERLSEICSDNAMVAGGGHNFISCTSAGEVYVRQLGNTTCSTEPCLTFNEYARQADV